MSTVLAIRALSRVNAHLNRLEIGISSFIAVFQLIGARNVVCAALNLIVSPQELPYSAGLLPIESDLTTSGRFTACGR